MIRKAGKRYPIHPQKLYKMAKIIIKNRQTGVTSEIEASKWEEVKNLPMYKGKFTVEQATKTPTPPEALEQKPTKKVRQNEAQAATATEAGQTEEN